MHKWLHIEFLLKEMANLEINTSWLKRITSNDNLLKIVNIINYMGFIEKNSSTSLIPKLSK